MKKYLVELFYTDIDNSLYTSQQASVMVNINADDQKTAFLVAEKLLSVYGADKYTVKLVG